MTYAEYIWETCVQQAYLECDGDPKAMAKFARGLFNDHMNWLFKQHCGKIK